MFMGRSGRSANQHVQTCSPTIVCGQPGEEGRNTKTTAQLTKEMNTKAKEMNTKAADKKAEAKKQPKTSIGQKVKAGYAGAVTAAKEGYAHAVKVGKEEFQNVRDKVKGLKTRAEVVAAAKDLATTLLKSMVGNGLTAYIAPYAKAVLTVKGGIDAVVVGAGIGGSVELLDLSIPVAVEAFLGGKLNAACVSLEITAKAGSGNLFLYAEAIHLFSAEFPLYQWEGLAWTFPDKATDGWLGKCWNV